MNKGSRAFSVISIFVIFIGFFSSCDSNNNDYISELKNNEIIIFPLNFYSISLSSVSGLPIKFNLEGTTFYCKTEKGSFSRDSDIKECNVNSGETVYYCPEYYNKSDLYTLIKENDYVDIIIQENKEIIGFSVVEINYYSSFEWRTNLITSNLFINQDGELVNVTEEYVNEKIKLNHK